MLKLKPGNANCTRCPLHTEARIVCMRGDGPKLAEIVVIGQNPGVEEDRAGRPFVGRSGKLLDSLLSAAGFDRSEMFVTNAVKCHSRNNRTPDADVIAACRPYLTYDLARIKPRFVLILGNVALQAIFPAAGSISDFRGRPIETPAGTVYFGTFHPSAGLYDPRAREIITKDLENFHMVVKHDNRVPVIRPIYDRSPWQRL